MKILLLFLTLAVLVFAIQAMTSRKTPKIGEIAPAGELKKKYGLTAENRPDIRINPQNVPANLRDLIPMAEKWGIGDDVIRDDFEEKTAEPEKKAFQKILTGRTREVSDWLDTFRGDSEMPEEAMHFMYMLAALDEMGLWPDE